MFGIDAPETPKGTKFPGQPYGPEAEAFLKQHVEGKRVTVEIYGIDRYQRLLSMIFLDGKDINSNPRSAWMPALTPRREQRWMSSPHISTGRAPLSYIMHWGLRREGAEPLDQGAAHGSVRHFYQYVASDPHARVQQAAKVAGMKIASWLRHMVRQIALTDFPASWREETSGERSHDSRDYDTRFMLRLGEPSREQL